MRRHFYYVVRSDVDFLKAGQVYISEAPIFTTGKPLKEGEEGTMEFYDEEKRTFRRVEIAYLGYADFKDEKDLYERAPAIIERKLKALEG